ncbi:AraC family transcriptional regulator [Lachnospiraceae bacterium LCP19S3_B12]|nr:AraC family transcriptional regulator [Lachnospiraceae bacterium OF09-33XD]
MSYFTDQLNICPQFGSRNCLVRPFAAKKMLRHSDAPVFYIAQKVGMDNVSYFIKLFKKYEQLTPHSYRSIWNTDSD